MNIDSFQATGLFPPENNRKSKDFLCFQGV